MLSRPALLQPSAGFWRLALWVALWAGLVSAAWGQALVAVPPLTARVMDTTQTLTPAQTQALSTQLEAIESQHGSQMVVLLVSSTQPEDVGSYTQRVADAWKLGRAGVGDGVLMVVAKDDRRVHLAIAKTLEGAIPDVIAGRIITEHIKPAFRAGDYAGGLQAAVVQINARLAGEALPAPAGKNQQSRGFDLQDLSIFLLVTVPVMGSVLTALFGRKLGSMLAGGAVGGVAWWLTASLWVAGGAGLLALFLIGVMGLGRAGHGGGWGGPMVWGHGGFSSGGGGGFSSGGGGDFGGGGASGDW